MRIFKKKVVSLYFDDAINGLDTCINMFEFSRAQIKHHDTKYFSNNQLHPDWKATCEKLKVKIVETDAGHECNYSMSLPVKVSSGTTITMSISVKFKNHDDDLGEKTFKRKTYIAYGIKGYGCAADLLNHIPSNVSYSEDYDGMTFTSKMLIKDSPY